MSAIVSMRQFAWSIGTPVARLRGIADDIERHYRSQPLRDKTSGAVLRHLQVPDKELMGIQRRIVKQIVEPIGYSALAHGGVPGRSPRSNASAHLAQPWLVTMDVREFFPSVEHKIILRRFLDLGFGRDVASLITRLVTYRGELPQGAASSTAVANLVMQGTDALAALVAPSADCQATRFVDDIAISGEHPVAILGPVARELSRSRLRIHRGRGKSGKPKLKIVPNCARQEVTGLVVNGKSGPSVSKARRDRIRAQVHQIDKASDARESVDSIRGKIHYVRQFNPGSAARIERQLDTALLRHSGAVEGLVRRAIEVREG